MLQGASEEGGFTMLQFERKLDTCDEDDLPINFVSVPAAYMYNDCACMCVV